MPAGRPPKMNELKSLQGTARKDRITESLDVIKFEDITQLKAINLKGLETAMAKKIFNDKANQLIANHMLAPQDIDQLIIYANAMEKVIECSKHMKKDLFSKTYDRNGKMCGYIPNPYLKLFKEMSEVVTRIGSEFGFTPLSRMKFKLEPEKEMDPLEKMLMEFNK